MTDMVFARPNAPISFLNDDLPMHFIMITDEAISETITDYQGELLIERDNWVDWKLDRHLDEIRHLKRFITVVDNMDTTGWWMDSTPNAGEAFIWWENLIKWVEESLLRRGWIRVEADGDSEFKLVKGK